MHDFVCGGLRADSFLGYLKTLGVFRTLAGQSDRRARLVLGDDGAALKSQRTQDEFEAFFLDTYAPTPIVNPWNKGGGVAKQSKSPSADALIRRIEGTTSRRWLPYRDAIAAARIAIEDAEAHGPMKDAEKKKLIVALFRARCPEEAIAWIDTAVVLGLRDAGFPPIVGSGGNDGRLDFGVTFAGYALAMMDGKSGRGVDRAALLRDSLYGTATAALVPGSLGQYAPATAVMFNLGNGMMGDGLVNPWDYVFALEGAVAFAGALVKRANTSDRPSYPFSFTAVAAGFGSASKGEETRGEIWLPVWSGAASWAAVAALLRRGRLEVDLSNERTTAARSARTSLDAVHGALTLGVASGLERMNRVVLAARNGLAYSGTSAGTIRVGDRRDPALASLNRETLQWITKTAALQIGGQALDAIRAYEDAVYAYGATRLDDRIQRAVAFQEVISALGLVDRTVALAPPKDHRPLPFLEAALLQPDGPLDDETAEHRIARAIASLGVWRANTPQASLRFDLVDVRHGAKGLVYGSDRATLWRSDTKSMLASLAARRTRDVASAKGDGVASYLLHASARANLEDFELLFSGDVDLDRLGRLVLGYSLIQPAQRPSASEREAVKIGANGAKELRESERSASSLSLNDAAWGSVSELPSAFAILKLAIDRVKVPGLDSVRPPIDAEIVPLLLANAGERALAIAERRLRATGFVPRDVSDIPINDPLLYAAALIIPGNAKMRRRCIRGAVRVLPKPPSLKLALTAQGEVP